MSDLTVQIFIPILVAVAVISTWLAIRFWIAFDRALTALNKRHHEIDGLKNSLEYIRRRSNDARDAIRNADLQLAADRIQLIRVRAYDATGVTMLPRETERQATIAPSPSGGEKP